MRLIDAEPIERKIQKAAHEEPSEDLGERARICAFRWALGVVLAAPTVGIDVGAEPDPPLTLDELREMDGEPVFVSFDGLVQRKFWAIVYVDQETGAVWAGNKFYTLYSHLYGRKWLAYRRKPEEGTK